MNNMMKTLTAATAAVLAGAAPAFDKGCETLDECKAYAERAFAVAETNVFSGCWMLRRVVSNLGAHYRTGADAAAVKAYCAEIDGRIADVSAKERRTAVGDWRCVYDSSLFPKTHGAEFDKGFYEAGDRESVIPALLKQAREKSLHVNAYTVADRASTDELVALLNEAFALADGKTNPEYRYHVVRHISTELQKKTQRKVRAYLRGQGKSFVTKDGVNPCATVMAELVAALNAPRLNGVNEWLEKVGATDGRIDVSKLPTDEEVAQLKEDILNGDKDMNVDYEFILKVCLGVEGYNSFVREFNGEVEE